MNPTGNDERIQTGPPDLLLLNAHVLTLGPGQPTAEAVAIRGDTIVAVGTTSHVASLAGPATQTIDCNGKTLMPGFVDSHCHLLALAAKLQGLDCSPKVADSIEELKQVLRRSAETSPSGKWVRGFGYDHLSLSERRHPSRWDLDQAVPNRPVRLDHRSGHATVLNSRALQIAGIDETTPDPVEGVIDRDIASGKPTGLLLELSAFLRQRLGTSGNQEEREKGVLALNNTLLSYGITSVQDAGADNGLDRWQAFKSMQASDRLSCRVAMMLGASRLAELQSEGLVWGGGDWLRLGNVKVMLTLTTGSLQPTEEALRVTVDQAHSAGFPVAIHAIEQEAVSAAAAVLRESSYRLEIPPTPLFKGRQGGISSLGPALGRGILPRDRIEHCAECPPQLVDLVRAAGATVVTQPGFIYWNGDDYLQRVEPSLLPHLYPVGALLKAGVPMAFGSDAPVIDPNPWPGIYSAVTRKTSGGNSLPPNDHRSTRRQEVSVLEALRMYTIAGAHAEGTERRKGTIQPGKLADLVLLDTDPSEATPARLKDIRAHLTIVGGRVVWREGF